MNKKSVLIISPHCDDAALSLGGMLLGSALGPAVETVVVFSRSAWVIPAYSALPVAQRTALRKKEERRAARTAHYRPRFLDLPEPFVRKGFARAQDVIDPLRDPGTDPIMPLVRAKLSVLRMHTYRLICAPLGYPRCHIDHRIIATYVRDLLQQDPSLPVAFYEDLPYTGRFPATYFWKQLTVLQKTIPLVSSVHKRASLRNKLRLLSIYASQFAPADLNFVATQWKRAGGERLWYTPGAHKAGKIDANP